MQTHKFLILAILLLCSALHLPAQENYMRQWPQFRGPFASGILDHADLPEKWDIRTGENIRWTLSIPGLGHSCPVVWDDRIFLTTAISGSGKDSLKVGLYGEIDPVNDRSVHEFRVYCIERHTGRILWERLAYKGVPATDRHPKSSHASSTPATDGKYVVAFFGSQGLYCYNFGGELLWKKEFGTMNAGPYTDPEVEWGFASSPILHEGKVIVQCDYLGGGFVAALDVESGREIWRTERDEISTWSTPNFYDRDDQRQVVVNGWRHIGGYDFDTGEQLWNLSGGGDAPAPTPFFAKGLIFIHNAHGRYSPIFAIRPEARGDITLDMDSTSSAFIPWSIKRGGAYLPTDLVCGDYLYNLRMNGNLTCYKALTGEVVYRERIPDALGISASGVCSDGRIYYSLEQGDVVVVRAGPRFEILSRNPLDDLIMATPALSEDMIYFRTRHSLIAVGKP
jgi:outer membrane protein assembly factor BamB